MVVEHYCTRICVHHKFRRPPRQTLAGLGLVSNLCSNKITGSGS